MVMERADKACSRPHLHTVRRSERDSALQPACRIGDRDRIVQRAERSDADVKAGFGHTGADIVGETAAKQHYSFGECHLYGTCPAFDHCLELQHYMISRFCKNTEKDATHARN